MRMIKNKWIFPWFIISWNADFSNVFAFPTRVLLIQSRPFIISQHVILRNIDSSVAYDSLHAKMCEAVTYRLARNFCTRLTKSTAFEMRSKLDQNRLHFASASTLLTHIVFHLSLVTFKRNWTGFNEKKVRLERFRLDSHGDQRRFLSKRNARTHHQPECIVTFRFRWCVSVCYLCWSLHVEAKHHAYFNCFMPLFLCCYYIFFSHLHRRWRAYACRYVAAEHRNR